MRNYGDFPRKPIQEKRKVAYWVQLPFKTEGALLFWKKKDALDYSYQTTVKEGRKYKEVKVKRVLIIC